MDDFSMNDNDPDETRRWTELFAKLDALEARTMALEAKIQLLCDTHTREDARVQNRAIRRGEPVRHFTASTTPRPTTSFFSTLFQ